MTISFGALPATTSCSAVPAVTGWMAARATTSSPAIAARTRGRRCGQQPAHRRLRTGCVRRHGAGQRVRSDHDFTTCPDGDRLAFAADVLEGFDPATSNLAAFFDLDGQADGTAL
jgi:hypothetical protein